jgi:hypothetical protein
MDEPNPLQPEPQVAYQRALMVKQAHEQELLGKPNVVGVGVGLRQQGGMLTDVIALIVMVRRKLGVSQIDPANLIPSEIDGVPVDVQEVGEIRAMDI